MSSLLPHPADPGAPQKPKSLLDTIITSTPVVMTVVATVLAGLSSGEMGRAQYFAANAARLQSKVGDQWSFFQAKRLRATSVENTLRLAQLQGSPPPMPIDATAITQGCDRVLAQFTAAAEEAEPAAALRSVTPFKTALATSRDTVLKLKRDATELVGNPDIASTLLLLTHGELPKVDTRPLTGDALQAAIKIIETPVSPDAEAATLGKVSDAELAAAHETLAQTSAVLDAAGKTPGKAIAQVDNLLRNLSLSLAAATRAAEDVDTDAPPAAVAVRHLSSAATISRRLNVDFTAAALRYDSARYQRESDVNRVTAALFEIEARKANLGAERHRSRSGYFFYGMLGAQAAVTLASLALAVKERSIFWSIATAIGAAAVAFGGYVYLFK